MRVLLLIFGLVACGDDDRGQPPGTCDPPLTQSEIDGYCFGLGFPTGCQVSCSPDVVIPPMCEPSLHCGDAGAPTCVCP